MAKPALNAAVFTRKEVESGKVVIVKCGDGTLHPIEAEFVRPEVHSLMQVDRPVVTKDQLDRVVLWVNQELNELKGTYAYHYIKWGQQADIPFAANRKAVPVAGSVPLVAGRDPMVRS